VFALYDPVPFGLQIDEFTAYATMQFQKRYMRLMQARGATLADVQAVTTAAIESEDA
jgi:ribonucleoside-diphosphate reductase beta chain